MIQASKKFINIWKFHYDLVCIGYANKENDSDKNSLGLYDSEK